MQVPEKSCVLQECGEEGAFRGQVASPSHPTLEQGEGLPGGGEPGQGLEPQCPQ